MFPEQLTERIGECGAIAVLTLDSEEDAVPLARALLAGGVEAMELTLRTPPAVGGLRAIVEEVPEMLAGVGTVLTPGQVMEVKEAGAAFAVAPGTNPRVVGAADEAGLPFAPGVATPSEIERAVELDCRTLKFFPAQPIGGLGYLKSMAGPYAHLGLRFMPLGGINSENATPYLESPLVLAVGGSFIARRERIRERDWDGITETAREVSALVSAALG